MKNILLFAGTTEGRLLAEFLIHQPVRLHTAVATAYGASLLPSAPSMTVSSHRMNEAQMIDFIQQQHFDLVLDATHPYASEASANISGACTRTQVPYLRILRDCQTSADTSSNPIHPSEIFVDTTAEAVDCLNHQEGPVFLTTGSKTLPDFMKINNASERVFVRILPNAEMLTACMSLGLPASHIFCMQGPFDVGMNTATIQHICRLCRQRIHLINRVFQRFHTCTVGIDRITYINDMLARRRCFLCLGSTSRCDLLYCDIDIVHGLNNLGKSLCKLCIAFRELRTLVLDHTDDLPQLTVQISDRLCDQSDLILALCKIFLIFTLCKIQIRNLINHFCEHI